MMDNTKRNIIINEIKSLLDYNKDNKDKLTISDVKTDIKECSNLYSFTLDEFKLVCDDILI